MHKQTNKQTKNIYTIRMECSLHKGKRFSEFIDQPDENGAYIYHPAFHPAYIYSYNLVRKGLETERFSEMVRDFPISIPNGKLGFYLEKNSGNFGENFREFLNGKKFSTLSQILPVLKCKTLRESRFSDHSRFAVGL